MAHTPTNDESLAEKWSIREMVVLVRSMIDEVECHVHLKESLPQKLVDGLYKTINNIEAEILSRRAALQDQIDRSDTSPASSKSEWEKNVLPTAIPQKEEDLKVSLAAKEGSPDSQNLGGQTSIKDSRPTMIDNQDVLDSLQDNIQAMQSVIQFRMDSSMPSKTSTTSNMVSFSVLEEEMEILDGLLEHVMGSESGIGDVLETKLKALPTLLSALFNTEIREAIEDDSSIDDEAMMDMVVENQKRTNVLRDIDSIVNQVKAVTKSFQDSARGC